jgi:hypothetical protein
MSDSEWWDVVYADEIDDAVDEPPDDTGNWLDDCEHDMQCTCFECLRALGYGDEERRR